MSLKLGIPVSRLGKELTVEQVMEYMAYDLSETEDFRQRVKRENELEHSRKLTPEAFAKQFKALLGGTKNG